MTAVGSRRGRRGNGSGPNARRWAWGPPTGQGLAVEGAARSSDLRHPDEQGPVCEAGDQTRTGMGTCERQPGGDGLAGAVAGRRGDGRRVGAGGADVSRAAVGVAGRVGRFERRVAERTFRSRGPNR